MLSDCASHGYHRSFVDVCARRMYLEVTVDNGVTVQELEALDDFKRIVADLLSCDVCLLLEAIVELMRRKSVERSAAPPARKWCVR